MDINQTVGLIALFAGLTTFFVLYAIYAPIVRKDVKPSVQADIFGGEQQPTFDADDSLGKYVRPVLNNFLPQFPNIKLGDERRKGLNELLLKSGNPWRLTPEEFIGLQIALSILGLLIGGAIGALNVLPSYLPPIVIVLFLAGSGFLIPYSVYNTRKENRTKAIEKELPEALDLLVITIASGQAFEFALDNVTRQLPAGTLKTEFSKVVVELQAGSTLEKSLTDLSTKFQSESLESFVKAVIQTSKLGSDVTETLKQQADFVRDNYKARLDRMIARLETTMFIPLIITMLPAFMIIFIAPTLNQISSFLF